MSKVGIVGLGLIGGSFAKAYHAAGWEVLAANRTRSVLDFAILAGEVDGALMDGNVGDCDLPGSCHPHHKGLSPVFREETGCDGLLRNQTCGL